MIRRVFALLGGGAALLTFASCSTFDTDNAATVNGTDITVEQLDAVRDDMAKNPDVWGLTEDDLDGGSAVDGDFTREVLSYFIQNEVFKDALGRAGAAVTEAELSEATTSIEGLLPDAPDQVRAVFAEGRAAGAALNELEAPDPSTLQATYEERPAATGIVCLRAATSTSKAEVEAARRTFEDGGEVTASDTLSVDDRCLLVVSSDQAVPGISTTFPPEQARSLIEATPGTLLPLVSGSTSAAEELSWQVVQVLHWEDASARFGELLASRPADAAVGGAYARAQVTVASEYGRWDPLAGAVVALTPAADIASS